MILLLLSQGLELTERSTRTRSHILLLHNFTAELKNADDLYDVVQSLRSIYNSQTCGDEDDNPGDICRRINETLLTFSKMEEIVECFPPELVDVAQEIENIVMEPDTNLLENWERAITKYDDIQKRVKEVVNKTEFEITEVLTEGRSGESWIARSFHVCHRRPS